MDERIKLFKEIAQKGAEVRKIFAAEREKNRAQAVLAEKTAQPIVKPIVEAIKRDAQALKTTSLSEDELQALIDQIPKSFAKTNFAVNIRKMYKSNLLFNTLLSMVQLEAITKFPINKMQKYGIIESLLFYGQGGTNLDNVPIYQQTPEYKARLEEFNNFYTGNERVIKMLINRDDDDDDSDSDLSFFPDTDYDIAQELIKKRDRLNSLDEMVSFESDRGDETLVEGEGLVDRLSLLHASRNAGNNSIELLNEASSIMKKLLKEGKICKKQYIAIEKEFKDQ